MLQIMLTFNLLKRKKLCKIQTQLEIIFLTISISTALLSVFTPTQVNK